MRSGFEDTGYRSDLDEDEEIGDNEQHHKSDEEQQSDEDDDIFEPKKLEAPEVVDILYKNQNDETDYEGIVQGCEDIEKVLGQLLIDYQSNTSSAFHHLKSLQNANASFDDIDNAELDNCLIKAFDNDNTEEAQFFIKVGAHKESSIRKNISSISLEMLESIEADIDEETIEKALENDATATLKYSLQEDFPLASELILREAAKESNTELVKLVAKQATLDQVYDLVQLLILVNGENLLPTLMESSDTEEFLNEIKDKDRGRGFFNATLTSLKKEKAIIDLELIKAFEEELKLDENLLNFPKEKFSGAEELKTIREELSSNKDLPETNRKTASLIGISLSTANRFFTQSPYHKFGPQSSETYFRSGKHPLSQSQEVEFDSDRSLPESKMEDSKKLNGGRAHFGEYKTATDNFTSNTEKVSVSKNNSSVSKDALFYDYLLETRKASCNYLIKKADLSKIKQPAIKIGFYHDYPCIMVYVTTPEIGKNTRDTACEKWVEIIISYFVGLVNAGAHQNGLDIELVRRSSFGFLTPTIAPCEKSFRINIGIVPNDYIDILAHSLARLNDVLTILNNPQENALNAQLPDSCFLSAQEYKKYIEKIPEKNKNRIENTKDILSLVWVKVENCGKSGGDSLTRTSAARDELALNVYNKLIKTSKKEDAAIFLDTLRLGFSKISVQKGGLRFSQANPIKLENVSIKHVYIKNEEYFKTIQLIHGKISKYLEENKKIMQKDIIYNMQFILSTIQTCIQGKNFQNLYYYTEMLNELLFAHTVFTSKEADEGFGSDSEDEDEVEKKPVYFNKLIVQNGMRAILASLHAGGNYLDPTYLESKKESDKPTLVLQSAYFETYDAVKLISKFSLIKKENSKAHILVYDLNGCEKEESSKEVAPNFDNFKVIILDSTSATTFQYHQYLKKFQQSKASVLFFVSSGFKHEQMGADKNPYGTIRVFAKKKDDREKIVAFIKKHETPINSSVSHNYRRLMKQMGNTPRNINIIAPAISLESEKENSFFTSINSRSG